MVACLATKDSPLHDLLMPRCHKKCKKGNFEALPVQAMDASEAKEMYHASLGHPTLVSQVVPSPFTFEYDATVQDIVKKGVLGELLYIEVSHGAAAQAMQARM